ncbi:MAG: MBL fold metallo-hydrolase [Armatimonadetes bacterium]|nr:MBL fold metallo-hydrolase [Armatimonadota bacterium]
MSARAMVCIFAVLSLAVAAPNVQGSGHAMKTPSGGPRVTVVYDNRSGAEGLEPAWGFACIVEGLEKTILFDTGGDGPRLLSNMAGLGFKPQDVDVVVLSHAHGDHVGGLNGFLDANGNVVVYLLESFPSSIGEDARGRGAEVVEVSQSTGICVGAELTGEIVGESGIPEESLLLLGDGGMAVITGCAHPGIVSIVERAKALTDREILVVLGGFHLVKDTEESISRIILDLKRLGVQHAIPCHCSGDLAIELFAKAFGAEFMRCSVGSVMAVGEMIGDAAADGQPPDERLR